LHICRDAFCICCLICNTIGTQRNMTNTVLFFCTTLSTHVTWFLSDGFLNLDQIFSPSTLWSTLTRFCTVALCWTLTRFCTLAMCWTLTTACTVPCCRRSCCSSSGSSCSTSRSCLHRQPTPYSTTWYKLLEIFFITEDVNLVLFYNH